MSMSMLFASSMSIVYMLEQNLVSWPWPLTYDLDIRTQPRYTLPRLACQSSSLYVSPFSQGSETDRRTDRQTDRQTHTQTMSKLLHPIADAGCKNRKTIIVTEEIILSFFLLLLQLILLWITSALRPPWGTSYSNQIHKPFHLCKCNTTTIIHSYRFVMWLP